MIRLLLLVMLFTPAMAAEANAKDHFLSGSFQKLASISGFRCQFEQLMVFSDGGGEHYAGTLAVLKPKYFRWQYQKPYAQLYVGDGRQIWHYEEDLMQAELLDDLESVDPAVMKLLSGTLAMADVEVLQRQPARHRYQLRIAGSTVVWLMFSKDGYLHTIERDDLMGNQNRMTLKKCVYIAPEKKRFSFTPPEGVEVLDMRSKNNRKDNP